MVVDNTRILIVSDGDYKEITRVVKRLEKKYLRKLGYNYENAGVQNAIKLLNEKDREEYGYPFFMRTNETPESTVLDAEGAWSQQNIKHEQNGLKTKKQYQRPTRRSHYGKQRRRSCNRRQMYVDFDEIGLVGWIISPKGFNAHHCKGPCEFP
ncbi:bone morphogenetic protein 3-like [Dreissena polymorpha]|uniref:bone morphogenetic protein 3-like n=1 Tax=Dreissena polymorpha TaxID=45954 RepID=UPI0022649357|nr:bone morphogenetic protein 3-like [Dreissena polymorpha]